MVGEEGRVKQTFFYKLSHTKMHVKEIGDPCFLKDVHDQISNNQGTSTQSKDFSC